MDAQFDQSMYGFIYWRWNATDQDYNIQVEPIEVDHMDVVATIEEAKEKAANDQAVLGDQFLVEIIQDLTA